MAQLFLNNFETTFIASVKDAPTSGTPATELDYGILRISDGAAGTLINPTGGDYYILTAFKRAGTVESDLEIMKVTAVNNSTPGECRITVQRAQEGTSAKGYVAGDRLALRLTAGATGIWLQQDDLDALEGRVVPRAGNVTLTGPLSVPAGASGTQVPRAQEVLLKTGDTMTGNLTVPSLNGGQLAGNRRRNLNGDCRIAQLGTSYPAANRHTIDMWWYGFAGAQVSTVTLEADAPAGSGFVYSHRSTVTTADSAIAADDYASHRTVIEGYDVADLVGKTFTVSFRVRSAKTGIHCVALRNSGLDRSYVHEFTIAAANTWESHKFTVVGGLPAGGTWNLTNGVGLEVGFTLAAGSTYHTTAGAWQTGSFIATANQVNVLDTIGNIFAVTGLQVELGDTATPYERRSIGAELSQVQRYGRLNGGLSGWTTSTTFINGLAVDFSSNPMRATPTIQLVNGTNTAHDPGIAMRDFSAPSYYGTNLGGYVSGTISATTANKLHNLLQGAVFFDARL